jgi:hypothetical protein
VTKIRHKLDPYHDLSSPAYFSRNRFASCRMAAPWSRTVAKATGAAISALIPAKVAALPCFVAVDQQHVSAPMSEHGRDIDGEQGLADSAFDVANREDHGRTLNSFWRGGVCTSPP